MEDADDLRNRAKQWREMAALRQPAAAGAMIETARELEAEADRLEREHRPVGPQALRDRAKRWREMATKQKPGAADAMLEAACELEAKAAALEREQRHRGRDREP